MGNIVCMPSKTQVDLIDTQGPDDVRPAQTPDLAMRPTGRGTAQPMAGMPARIPAPPVGAAGAARTERSARSATDKIVARKNKQDVSPSLDDLPLLELGKYLKRHDPVRNLGLTSRSVFYRVTERKWIANDAIAGNPDSIAEIMNHLAVKENPWLALMQHELRRPSLDADMRDSLTNEIATTNRYCPTEMWATDLAQPTLNVMWGSEAKKAAMGYWKPGRVLVQFTLGDLRKAGGGAVFYDNSSVVRGDTETVPLIVTLPRDRTVPIKILGPDPDAHRDADCNRP